MPLDLPKNRQAISRSRAVEVIERTQEDALRKLRQSGLPEQQALMVMQRISAFCLRTLRELDVIYSEFEELVELELGRSEAHQRWLNDKSAALLLQVEAGLAEIVATVIRQAIHDLQHPPSPPQDVITVPAKPSRPAWLAFLLTAPRFLWCGLPAWLPGCSWVGRQLAGQSSRPHLPCFSPLCCGFSLVPTGGALFCRLARLDY
jgi:hypothetical protein